VRSDAILSNVISCLRVAAKGVHFVRPPSACYRTLRCPRAEGQIRCRYPRCPVLPMSSAP